MDASPMMRCLAAAKDGSSIWGGLPAYKPRQRIWRRITQWRKREGISFTLLRERYRNSGLIRRYDELSELFWKQRASLTSKFAPPPSERREVKVPVELVPGTPRFPEGPVIPEPLVQEMLRNSRAEAEKAKAELKRVSEQLRAVTESTTKKISNLQKWCLHFEEKVVPSLKRRLATAQGELASLIQRGMPAPLPPGRTWGLGYQPRKMRACVGCSVVRPHGSGHCPSCGLSDGSDDEDTPLRFTLKPSYEGKSGAVELPPVAPASRHSFAMVKASRGEAKRGRARASRGPRGNRGANRGHVKRGSPKTSNSSRGGPRASMPSPAVLGRFGWDPWSLILDLERSYETDED